MTAIHLHSFSQRAAHPGFGSHVAAALRTWRERAQGRSELARLDARSLRDLGLSNVDVTFEANKPFWRA